MQQNPGQYDQSPSTDIQNTSNAQSQNSVAIPRTKGPVTSWPTPPPEKPCLSCSTDVAR